MTTVPGSLVWELVKKNNCFLIKQFGNSNIKVEYYFSDENLPTDEFIGHRFCYRKSGKDDSSQDPMTQPVSSPLSRQSLSTLTGFFLKNQEFRKMAKAVKNQKNRWCHFCRDKVLTGRAPSPAGRRPGPRREGHGRDGRERGRRRRSGGGVGLQEEEAKPRRPPDDLDGAVGVEEEELGEVAHEAFAGKGEATGWRALRGSLPTPSGSAPNSLSPGSCGRQRCAVGLLLEEDDSKFGPD
ncbi:hypothetical protein QYE76_069277 [Lolium multiflorum]|uniref:Uncharacterized protein n=1 Tax=Lolium multiflorum TaxID=4521 RepID=A0AAD8SG01_LOLMU|nr:hypothetical protein QYE76_069277 [Lolium multiflorum]